MIGRFFGIVCAAAGLFFLLQEIWTVAIWNLPGKASDDSGFYIVLGLSLLSLAFVTIFYKPEEEKHDDE